MLHWRRRRLTRPLDPPSFPSVYDQIFKHYGKRLDYEEGKLFSIVLCWTQGQIQRSKLVNTAWCKKRETQLKVSGKESPMIDWNDFREKVKWNSKCLFIILA